jgi:hypothetical protein
VFKLKYHQSNLLEQKLELLCRQFDISLQKLESWEIVMDMCIFQPSHEPEMKGKKKQKIIEKNIE